MNNKTQSAVSTVLPTVWWQRLWAVLPAAMLSCGLFLAASSSLLYAPDAEAANLCNTGDTYATTTTSHNCKAYCQTQANFNNATWNTYCKLPAGAGFCNDAARVNAYTGATNWFTACGLTPATAYGNTVAKTWCNNSGSFATANWNTYCQNSYCTAPTNINTANWWLSTSCAVGGAYVSSYTKSWCDTPANYGNAAWNTNCKTPYCAAPANAGTAGWFLTTTCGAPTPYTSATTASWCKNSANFGNANWTTYCRTAYCTDSTQVSAAGGVWFTGCGLTPATAYANATAKAFCDNTANFSSVVGSNWDTYCRSSYCSAVGNIGTTNWFNTNGCAAGGVYVNPTTKTWCQTVSNAGTAIWNTNCQASVCTDPAIIGTAPWFLTTTCGSPTPYTSSYIATWCKTPANFANPNWAANCGAPYCADQLQGPVAGGAWFTQCGVPTPYTAVGSTNTWCQNAANYGTANWITYCQAPYCADGTKIGTAAWFATNTCGAGGVYVSPTTKAWCDTPANFSSVAGSSWVTYCKTPYCAAAPNIGNLAWFNLNTCGGPTVYTSTVTGPWCKNSANFGHANWSSQCSVAYCGDQTQGALAGAAPNWFTKCGLPTPYTATGSTNTWCQNAANYGTANWNTYCKADYCADPAKIATAAWFGTNTCATGGVYVSATTKAWCDTPANYGTATWNTYCKTPYCTAGANAGTTDWFLASTCGSPIPYTSPYIGTWCKTPANFSNLNWGPECGLDYCQDQTRGAVVGAVNWFTTCGMPDPYTDVNTGVWCATAANFGTANWVTYCKTPYCVDPAKIGTTAWFSTTTCGAPNPYTSPDTGTWCKDTANSGNINWVNYCKANYCADSTRGNINIPPVTASPAPYVPVTPNWFSLCAAAGGAYADADTAGWCSTAANYSGSNAEQWTAYCASGWCGDAARFTDGDWIGNCNYSGGWCDAQYNGLSTKSAAIKAQWFSSCQAASCQTPPLSVTPATAASTIVDTNNAKYACTCPNAEWLNAASCVVGVGTLAQYPLELGSAVPPNLLILQDDSGSMDWETVTDYPQGMFYPGRTLNPNTGTCTPACTNGREDSFSYMFRTKTSGGTTIDQYTGSQYGNVLWPNEMDEAIVGQAYQPQAGWTGTGKGPWGFWRGRNSTFNRVYYNPNVTYSPWKGVDATGTPFGNASFTAAPVDPYRPTTGGTQDLSALVSVNNNNTFKDANGNNWSPSPNTFNLYIPTYYLWTDTNTAVPAQAGNGVVDAKDTHVKVEVKSTVTSYTVSSARKDCAGVVAGGTTCNFAEESQNFANWFTYYRNRFLMAKGSLGETIWPENNLRMGVSFIDGSGGLRINDISTTANKNLMLQSLYSEDYNSVGTPLRSALDKAGKYFMCASGDIYGSAASSAAGTANCPVMSPTSALTWNKGQGKCQQNYTLLTTDGFWNGGGPTLGNVDGSATATPYNRGAFGDTSSDTLSDVALYYYQTDLWTGLNNEVATTQTDKDFQVTGTAGSTMHQHMGTYTIGFGIQGELTDAQVANIELKANKNVAANPAWPAPTADALTTADDLTHAAFNGRGQYLNAGNTTELQTALSTVFDNILAGVGNIARGAFSSQTLSTSTVTYGAKFNTVDNSGELTANALVFVCGDGSTTPGCAKVESVGAPIWSAAARLDSKVTNTTSSRVLATYNRVTGKAVPFNKTAYALAAGSTGAWSPAMKTTLSANMVDYLRGVRGYETGRFIGGVAGTMRPRAATSGLLGDIVNSSPQYVGIPSFTGRSGWQAPTVSYAAFRAANNTRTPMVYVGANDGILHGFNATTGDEVFGYVPGHLFDVAPSADTLDKLTVPSYQHHFYVDLAPTYEDVFYSGAWHSIIVGGFRAGGRGYFALDVTDPSAMTTEAGVVSKFLWEHTDVEDADMGFSFSHPAAGLFNDGGTYVAVGNGYGSANNEAVLLLMSVAPNAATGQPATIQKVHTGAFGTGFGLQPLNGLGDIRQIDLDSDGDMDLIYAGDYLGNVWRFDVRSSSAAAWSAHKIFTATSDTGGMQPVVTRPMVVPHPDNISGGLLGAVTKVVVVFATGTYQFKSDGADSSHQSIYGIQDTLTGAYVTDRSKLIEQTIATKSYTSAYSGTIATREVSRNPTATNGVIDYSAKDGWFADFIDFRDGERAIRELKLVGSRVDVNTIVPPLSTECTVNVGGFTMSFNAFYGSGPLPLTPFYDLNHDGLINASDLNTDGSVPAGFALYGVIAPDSAVLCSGSVCATMSGSTLTNSKPDMQPVAGRVSWKEINN